MNLNVPARMRSMARPETEADARGDFAGPLGAELRRRREEAGVTLRALARELGVSPSLISQIEHGKANPSVGTLYAIVTALDISLDQLFLETGPRSGGSAAGPPSRSADRRRAAAAVDGPVLRKPDRPSLTLASGVRWERLTTTPDPEVDFLYVTYEVNGESCPPNALMRHSGREYGLVLQGRLGATVGFENYELDVGDSIAFDSTTPHRFWTIGDVPSVVVWTVVGRHDDPRVRHAE
jgi:transcriptional regulator with XRE-family HTH domain